MSRNFHAEIHLHVTWHCKDSAPWLIPSIEAIVHDHIRTRIVKEDGAVFRETGGTETHVHVVASVLPTLHVSEWIGRLKGGSSYAVNHAAPSSQGFEWQTGYGVVCLRPGIWMAFASMCEIRRSIMRKEPFDWRWNDSRPRKP